MKCPHCLTAFHDKWSAADLLQDRERIIWVGQSTICPECGRIIVRLVKYLPVNNQRLQRGDPVFVFPKASGRPPVAVEVPAEFSDDYREACLVLSDSPKASAALSRRLLQHIIREKAGINKKDLATEIQELIDSGKLPSHLTEAVDGVRNIGNFAAHPMKSTNSGEVLDVEPGEAEWLLDTVEGMFDYYFVQPELLKTKRAALDAKLKDAGKPPMK